MFKSDRRGEGGSPGGGGGEVTRNCYVEIT